MRFFRQFLLPVMLVAGFFSAASAVLPTHADLAAYVAKGDFKQSVPVDATLEQCVAFLERQGICFSLVALMDPGVPVTREDCARVVGQSTLIFLGEAEVVNGHVKKPSRIKTWVDYCLLNDVDFPGYWNRFLKRMEYGHLPEVRRFFKFRLQGERK